MNNEKKLQSDAIRAGEKAIKSLKYARKSLAKCRERGLLDVLGPLSLSSGKKNAVADDAKKCIRDAKGDLKLFGDKISVIFPDSVIVGLSDKLFSNVNSFDKSGIDKFDRLINEGIKEVESAIRNLKKIDG